MRRLGWITAWTCVLVMAGVVAYSLYGSAASIPDPTPAELEARTALRSADVGDLVVWGEELYVVSAPTRDNEMILGRVFPAGLSGGTFSLSVRVLARDGASVVLHGSPGHSRLLTEHFSRRWRPTGHRVGEVEKK